MLKLFSTLSLRRRNRRTNPLPPPQSSSPNFNPDLNPHPIVEPAQSNGGSVSACSSSLYLSAKDGDGISAELSSEDLQDTAASSSSSGERHYHSVIDYHHSGDETPSTSASNSRKREDMMDRPPSDDCCPICFNAFSIPCRGPCRHWFCGACILQYWNYSAALQPCNCPMCSQKITKLIPQSSLYQEQQDPDIAEVLKSVQKYNRLFVGGAYGFFLKVLESPLYIKRVVREMMNPDRPGAHLNKMRIFAIFLGVLYTLSPFDFLGIGRQNVIDVFDYSAIALSFILYFVGLYLRRRRFQHVRELAAIQP